MENKIESKVEQNIEESESQIDTEQEISKIENVEPQIDIQKRNEVKIMKKFISKCNSSVGEDLKLAVINELFGYLKNNRVFLNDNDCFQQVVKNKLVEFYKYYPKFQVPMKQHYFELFNSDIEPLL